MPLLVVPLGPEQCGLLTMSEWEALLAADAIAFERPGHPLAEKLRTAGKRAGEFDDEPAADAHGWALVCDPDSPRVLDLARAGATVTAGAAFAVDDLTAAHGAGVVRRAQAAFGDLVAIMARLRSDDGCPWDRTQTHTSLKIHLLEEAYEVIDAIDRNETGEELEDELGDVLLQVAFHARLAEQEERFDVAGVARRIAGKLVYRHPHVFGDVTVSGADEVVANWETLKAREKDAPDGAFDGLPSALPALLMAYKVQKRAARLGFEADVDAARDRLLAAVGAAGDAAGAPTGDSSSIGEALFWLVALARAAGVDPEGALRASVTRFTESFSSGR